MDRATGSSCPADSAPPIDFEETLEQVESVVRELESGELGLQESLAQYERAVGQIKSCYALLESAERRISVLSGFDAEGNPVLAAMDDGPEAQPER